jgi:hypothetical protein
MRGLIFYDTTAVFSIPFRRAAGLRLFFCISAFQSCPETATLCPAGRAFKPINLNFFGLSSSEHTCLMARGLRFFKHTDFEERVR